MSTCYMKKEKGDGTIVKVSLSRWANYRNRGYVFCNTPEAHAEYLAQQSAAPKKTAAPAKKKASKKKS